VGVGVERIALAGNDGMVLQCAIVAAIAAIVAAIAAIAAIVAAIATAVE